MLEETEERTRRRSLGPVSTMSVEEARRACHARRAVAEPERTVRATPLVPLFRDFVDGEWREAHFGRCKPSTQRTLRHQLARRILPAVGSTPLDRIARA